MKNIVPTVRNFDAWIVAASSYPFSCASCQVHMLWRNQTMHWRPSTEPLASTPRTRYANSIGPLFSLPMKSTRYSPTCIMTLSSQDSAFTRAFTKTNQKTSKVLKLAAESLKCCLHCKKKNLLFSKTNVYYTFRYIYLRLRCKYFFFFKCLCLKWTNLRKFGYLYWKTRQKYRGRTSLFAVWSKGKNIFIFWWFGAEVFKP